MIIDFIAIGNSSEAFIENSLTHNLNLISSDDNNRGKTILIQSMMYCLGNKPIFPSTFNFKNYYHIVGFSEGEQKFKICRKDNSFILLNQKKIMFFDNTSELKRYWKKHIRELPIILKDGINKIVDLELFYQLNFVGQDKKDTSNIANKGYYKNIDFYNMLLSIANISSENISTENIDELKKELSSLKTKRDVLLKQHKILSSDNPAAIYLSNANNTEKFEVQVKKLEVIKEQLTELIKLRNNALNRKNKCEITIKELRSLNRIIEHGELKCLDCNSKHINYFSSGKKAYNFDVSTPEIRTQIIDSISDKIDAYNEEINSITYEINVRQTEIKNILFQDEINLETLIAFKEDFFKASDTENRIIEIDTEIKKLEQLIKSSSENSAELAEKQDVLIKQIIDLMNETYSKIDPDGNLKFEKIFTKSNQVFSGSEATIYHLVKLYSLAKIMNHNLPLIVDSFRAEDLSTEKEYEVLNLFSTLGSQIIFTTTLKTEEIGKYDNQSIINHIDYSNHSPSKILNPKHVQKFKLLMNDFSITL